MQVGRDALADLESFVAHLRTLDVVRSLWTEALEWLKGAVEGVVAAHWTMSLEL